MTTSEQATSSTGLDGPLAEALVGTRRFFTRGTVSDDGRSLSLKGGRSGDSFYRDRWSHDKVVRSTHGVNCTGSCSWKVYVKDGIITWEAQQTDYPSAGADRPDYEPRGCPRGAAFSWYTYSPTRIRYPYVRGVLLGMFREAKKAHGGDPVLAWASLVEDPAKAARYKAARGKGGLVRASWEEVVELVAAAHVHTVKAHGPDRIAGFSPIPAMSPVSYASGARFLELVGAPMLSFYDWYADLPNASPQMFGDQTDVPESGDWWDAAYLFMWGSNVPLTRTPDAHWMAEARYRGQKVVAVAPDYAENVKFADEWVTLGPGTDGALAMAMGHVLLKEFFVDRLEPFFADYNKQYTDLANLVVLTPGQGGDAGPYRPGKYLVAGDVEGGPKSDSENAMWKPAVIDARSGELAVLNGSIGDRFGEEGVGKWNLELGDTDPLLTLHGTTDEAVEVELPRFDAADGKVAHEARGVPVRRIGDRLVTTVLDLLLAQYGVARDGLPGTWPTGYDDPSVPATPAWQEQHTGVPAAQVERLAREWGQNAVDTQGRGMILLGAGTNHWFHSDQIYRAILLLTTITGCQGRNGGGWAHYVGQEKIRPIMGFQHMAFALDWQRPPRHMNQTAYWYVHTSQYRYDTFSADDLDSGTGVFAGKSVMDLLSQSVRLGWTPSYPTFDRSSLDLADDAAAAGMDAPAYVAQELKEGRLGFAVDDPESGSNHPRVLSLWRSNLLGSSAKGNEYFLRHLLGTDSAATATEAGPEHRPQGIEWP
ncbi:MAG: molybdopterin-dependent oxidoreductase, partial [Terrabacter sp.]